jgi:hypothetical protein
LLTFNHLRILRLAISHTPEGNSLKSIHTLDPSEFVPGY